MSNSISTLLLRNLHDVFGEIDPVRRRAAIDEIFHEDAVFYEPNGTQATTDLGRLDRGRTLPCLERSSCTDRAFEPLRCEKSRPPHLMEEFRSHGRTTRSSRREPKARR